MMAKFIKDEDKRLNQVSDFEVQVISNENGVIVDSNWYSDTTFNKVFDDLELKHENELEISVLDYGDELKAIITPSENMFNHHYTVLMID